MAVAAIVSKDSKHIISGRNVISQEYIRIEEVAGICIRDGMCANKCHQRYIEFQPLHKHAVSMYFSYTVMCSIVPVICCFGDHCLIHFYLHVQHKHTYTLSVESTYIVGAHFGSLDSIS